MIASLAGGLDFRVVFVNNWKGNRGRNLPHVPGVGARYRMQERACLVFPQLSNRGSCLSALEKRSKARAIGSGAGASTSLELGACSSTLSCWLLIRQSVACRPKRRRMTSLEDGPTLSRQNFSTPELESSGLLEISILSTVSHLKPCLARPNSPSLGRRPLQPPRSSLCTTSKRQRRRSVYAI